MTGVFSNVDKPVKTKDRFFRKEGGGFELALLQGQVQGSSPSGPTQHTSPTSDLDITSSDTGSVCGNKDLKTLVIGPTSAAVSSLSTEEQSEGTSGTLGSGDTTKQPIWMSDHFLRHKKKKNRKSNKVCANPCA